MSDEITEDGIYVASAGLSYGGYSFVRYGVVDYTGIVDFTLSELVNKFFLRKLFAHLLHQIGIHIAYMDLINSLSSATLGYSTIFRIKNGVFPSIQQLITYILIILFSEQLLGKYIIKWMKQGNYTNKVDQKSGNTRFKQKMISKKN